MAYEIIEQKMNRLPGRGDTPRSQFIVIDPHPTHPIVDSTHYNKADAEAALAEIKRDEAITDSFDAWIHATAEEHGVTRSTVTHLLDLSEYR